MGATSFSRLPFNSFNTFKLSCLTPALLHRVHFHPGPASPAPGGLMARGKSPLRVGEVLWWRWLGWEVPGALYVGLLGRECCVPSSHPASAAGSGHVRPRPLSCASLLFLKFIFRCSLASSSSCAALLSLFLTPSSRIAFLSSQFLLKAIFAGLCLRLGAGPAWP